MSYPTIAVTPEGRDGVYLADRASLKAYIVARQFDCIHNFTPARSVVIGADHGVDSVLADIDKADRVAVLTGAAARGNFGHALALIMPPDGIRSERLEMFDIGEIDEASLNCEAAMDGDT